MLRKLAVVVAFAATLSSSVAAAAAAASHQGAYPDALCAATAAVMKSAEFTGGLAARGAEPLLPGPAAFAEYIRGESEKWAKVVKAGKIASQ